MKFAGELHTAFMQWTGRPGRLVVGTGGTIFERRDVLGKSGLHFPVQELVHGVPNGPVGVTEQYHILCSVTAMYGYCTVFIPIDVKYHLVLGGLGRSREGRAPSDTVQ